MGWGGVAGMDGVRWGRWDGVKDECIDPGKMSASILRGSIEL